MVCDIVEVWQVCGRLADVHLLVLLALLSPLLLRCVLLMAEMGIGEGQEWS